ncbi:hypothetical protein LbFV_ORF102 [Leptopilina boulardi filamentous virus]|uniref:Uncharacterized protein n=1 Tax=Leptopilina boulardi filamentous virus TaxID=552509 RepID=A0A1S5YD45_9VIRU|nr:hypothetical protein LbFV_ORF102 [Leptopilina boulardi filamentous virus]AQQ80022.1 hypothetical protein LbFV_ORF102 [Leptopilina boulardi filamentous virus]
MSSSCTVKNIFHQSENGCSMDNFNGQSIHLYYSTQYSVHPKTGIPLIKMLYNINDNINLEYQLNSLKATVITNITSDDINDISKFLNVYNFKIFLKTMIEIYFDNPIIIHDNDNDDDDNENILRHYEQRKKKHIYMYPKNFMDIYVIPQLNDGFTIDWFRPVNFIYDKRKILLGWQFIFLECLNIACKNLKIETNNLLENIDTRYRNLKKCHIRFFLKRPPPHLRCGEKYSKNNFTCSHQKSFKLFNNQNTNDDEEYIELKKNAKEALLYISTHNLFKDSYQICNKLLLRIGDLIGYDELTRKLNYKCNLLTKEKMLVCNLVFGRAETLHSILCCPTILINDNYIYSISELFHCKKISFS